MALLRGALLGGLAAECFQREPKTVLCLPTPGICCYMPEPIASAMNKPDYVVRGVATVARL
jgi:hypothetical protein